MAFSITSLDDISTLENDDDLLLAFLLKHKLLPSERVCRSCMNKCEILKRGSYFIFICRRTKDGRRCNEKISLNNDTWFEKCHLPYVSVIKIIYCFVINIPIFQASQILNISNKTLVDWYTFCRDVCIAASFEDNKLGGPNTIVEISENKFGSKKERKEGQWVFGGIERGTVNCFFVPFEKHDERTLLRIVKDKIKPGTTIISDSSKGYNFLNDEGFLHQTVNGSKTIIDPMANAHTKTINSMWFSIKHSMPQSGKKNWEGYLALFMWRVKNKENLLEKFIEDINKIYPL